jgi:hypothetical protein
MAQLRRPGCDGVPAGSVIELLGTDGKVCICTLAATDILVGAEDTGLTRSAGDGTVAR